VTPDTKVDDKPLDIAGWKPQNFDFKFRGQVTVREAASHSLNIPAINLLQRVGLEKSAGFAAQLGIPIAKEDRSLNLALGSMNRGINPLQLAGAYQAFANGGTYVQPHLITRVEAADGPLPAKPVETHRAMAPKTAYLVTDVLKTVVKEGTGVGALLNRPMAGKTGTVELPGIPEFQGKKGSAAAWFVGYTPDLVGAIWLGYDQTNQEHFLPPEVNGSTHPTRIWQQVVGAFLDGQPALPFPGPDGKLPQAAKPPAAVKPPEPTPPQTEAPLPGIRGLTASPGIAPGTVDVRWDVDAGQTGAVAFQVARGTTPDVPMDRAVALVPGSSFTDMPPGPGT
jgi:membrane peptidoglycan carboxypeptidase